MESTVWNTTTQIVCHKHQNILEKGPLLVVEGEKGGDLAAELHSGFQICLNPEPPSHHLGSHVIDETLTACLLSHFLCYMPQIFVIHSGT